MTGVHRVQFIRQGKIVKEHLIEAIQLSPRFSRAKHPQSIQSKIGVWLITAKEGDKIIIETELEE